MSKNRTNNRGKVVAQCEGYRIRKMVEKKPNPKKEQWPKFQCISMIPGVGQEQKV